MTAGELIPLLAAVISIVAPVLIVGRTLERIARHGEAIRKLEEGSVSKGERLEALARELAALEGRIQGRIEGEQSAAHRLT
jgi:hypothetical protein